MSEDDSKNVPIWVKKVLGTLDGVKLIFDKLKEIAKDVPVIVAGLGFTGTAAVNFFGLEIPWFSKKDVEKEIVKNIENDIEGGSATKPYHKKKMSKGFNEYEQQSQQVQAEVQYHKSIYAPHVPNTVSEWAWRLSAQLVVFAIMIWTIKRVTKKKEEKRKS